MSQTDPTDEIAAADVRNGEPDTIADAEPRGDGADGEGLEQDPAPGQMPSDTDVQAERQP